jgi:hypothetical protein
MRRFPAIALLTGIAAPMFGCATPSQYETSANDSDLVLVEIRGCCSFRTSGALRAGDGSVPVEGFLPRVIESESEKVRIAPQLGYYGWLKAEGGAEVRIGGYRGLATSSANGTKAVIALERVADQGTPLSVEISSNCQGSCELFRQVLKTFEIERQWKVREP